MTPTFLRITSHRSQARLEAALRRKPQYWFSFRREGYWAEVSPQEADRVLPIKGITRSLSRPDMFKCWE